MSTSTEVAIVGAGPYALSIAAHLRAAGVDFRIFGKPMQSWASHMPKDMFLKSRGFASNLSEPENRHTLKRFCDDNGHAYADTDAPVPLDTFTAYGRDFQRRLVPNVEEKFVAALDRSQNGFQLRLDDGEDFAARRVVVATGLASFQHIPDVLAQLPPEVVSHSSAHRDVSRFKGRSVSVVGGGSSALDLVAALHDNGINARLIARRPALRWNPPLSSEKRGGLVPLSGLGPGWRNVLYENVPMLFRMLPPNTRMGIVRRWLGPSGGWPAKQSVEKSELLLGRSVDAAEYRAGRVYLRTTDADGKAQEIATDHVIAATGYKVDLRRLGFLGKEIVANVRSIENTPVLSQNFQSSIPGLYFIGLSAANSFGPVMRFLVGAHYTAQTLARTLANGAAKR